VHKNATKISFILLPLARHSLVLKVTKSHLTKICNIYHLGCIQSCFRNNFIKC